jgi:hypothetical protein
MMEAPYKRPPESEVEDVLFGAVHGYVRISFSSCAWYGPSGKLREASVVPTFRGDVSGKTLGRNPAPALVFISQRYGFSSFWSTSPPYCELESCGKDLEGTGHTTSLPWKDQKCL